MSPEAKSRFLAVLLVIAIALVAGMLWSFAGSFFAAAVLASVLHTPQKRLAARLGNRRYLAAAALTSGVVLIVVLPLAVTSVYVVREGQQVVTWLRETLRERGVEGLVEPLPDALEPYAKELIAKLPIEVLPLPDANVRRAPPVGTPSTSPWETAPASVATAESDWMPVVNTLRDLAARLLGMLLVFGVFMLATFFLLADGVPLVEYLVDLAPLDEARTRELLGEFRSVSVGVLLSVLSTAVAQTAAAGLGYWIAGVRPMALALLATCLCSFIPSIGGAGVTITIGALVAASGRVGMGLFLIAWGILVVGLIDNVVKPWVAKDRAHLPASVVFFAMVCGLALFGPLGLVAGPLIAAFFHVVAGFWRAEQGRADMTARHAPRKLRSSA